MSENPKPRPPTRAVWIIGGTVLLAVILASSSLILGEGYNGERQLTLSNMRTVGYALLEFDQEFSSFPSDKTAHRVIELTGTDLDLSGQDSNDYFRQLIAFGIKSEDMPGLPSPTSRTWR